MKHVIIIGSGLGGLTTGVFLAKNGYKVTILEKEPTIGGCLQCFTRKGKKYETGMHFIGSAAPGQSLRKLMRYLEIDDQIQLSALDPTGYDVVSIDGKQYRFANGREAFIRQMCVDFPHERENLEHYFDLIDRVAAASNLHSLKQNDSNSPIDIECQLRSIDDVVGSIIHDPLLQKVLVGNLPLYAGERGKTPFSTHAFIMDFYNQSAYRIVGGSDQIATALQRTLEKYGAQVLPRSQVTEILCDDRHATGVTVNHDTQIAADYVISAIHPQRTLEMLHSPLIRPAYRNRIKNIPNTVSCFVVYLDFKEGAMPYMNHNFYGYRSGTPWDCERYDAANWPKGYLYLHLCHEDNARYASTGEIICYMWMKDVAQWAGTRPGHRGKDYEAFKEKTAERLLEAVERDFPGLRASLNGYYTSTPLTYLDYTGTAEGCMYGVAKDINLGASCRISDRTKIPNLFFTGQNINSHGMLGVLVGTIVTCSELLGTDTIYRQIFEANKA